MASSSNSVQQNGVAAAAVAAVAAAAAAPVKETASVPQYSMPAPSQHPQSKYSQLLAVIEELGKDIRPTYTGNKMSAERLKRSIIHARILVRECLMETEKTANRP